METWFNCSFPVLFFESKCRLFSKKEVKNYEPHSSIILCATKIDLREDENTLDKLKDKGQKPVSFKEGCKMAKEIGAFSYCETSSLKGIVSLPFFQYFATQKVSLSLIGAKRGY